MKPLLTLEQIDKLPVGRELDIAVAEAMTGQARHQCRIDPVNRNGEPQFHWGYPHGHDFAPDYSSNITAAWKVFIDGLLSTGNASIEADMEDYGRGTFLGTGPEEILRVTIGAWTTTDKVEPAICRAYLHAKYYPEGPEEREAVHEPVDTRTSE